MRNLNIRNRLAEVSPAIKATVAFTFCNILQKGVSYLTTPLFTRLMSTEQYGQYTLYNSWLNIILVVATLKLSAGVYHKGLIEFSDDRDSYSSSMLGLSTTATLVTAVVYLLFKSFFDSVIGLPDIVILFMFIELLAEPALSIWSAKQRHYYKYKALLVVTLALAVAQSVIGLVAVTISEEKGIAKILSVALVNILIGLILYVVLFRRGKCFFNKKYWKYALAFNLPLIPHYLSYMLLAQSDRIMIARLCGETDAAIYALASQISMVMTLVTNALNSTLQPWVFQKLKAKSYSEISKYGTLLMFFVMAITLAAAVFAPELIMIFGGDSYVEGTWLVPALSLSVFFQFLYYLFVYVDYYYNETKSVMISTVVSALLNIGLNYILLPLFGYEIAAYTTVVSYVVYVIFMFVSMRRTLRKNNITERIYDGRVIAIACTVLVAVSQLLMITYNYTIIRYSLIIVSIVLLVAFRKQLISLYKSTLSNLRAGK
ncbi:MAG: oligosaccharide flippase family protein [Oscillospiraceae bacterium]|nr:oligosaccharide flippase family protein [Oscillospiraceae bacterium]